MPRSIARHILTVLLRGSDHEPEVGTNGLIFRRAPSLETVGKRNQVNQLHPLSFRGWIVSTTQEPSNLYALFQDYVKLLKERYRLTEQR